MFDYFAKFKERRYAYDSFNFWLRQAEENRYHARQRLKWGKTNMAASFENVAAMSISNARFWVDQIVKMERSDAKKASTRSKLEEQIEKVIQS